MYCRHRKLKMISHTAELQELACLPPSLTSSAASVSVGRVTLPGWRTTTAKEVLRDTSFGVTPPGRLRRKRSSKVHRLDTGHRDDYGERGPPWHTVSTQAAGTTTAKEALQGTPCGRRPPGRLRRRRSSKAYRLDVDRRDDYDEVGPPRHTVWTQATGTPINEVGWWLGLERKRLSHSFILHRAEMPVQYKSAVCWELVIGGMRLQLGPP